MTDAEAGRSAPFPPAPARLRLPRAARLAHRREYARIQARGVRAKGRLIVALATPGLNPGTPRLGLSVSRRYSKSAVVRNRFRRLCREAFRLERARLPCLDLVLMPALPATRPTLAALRDELVTLAQRLERKLGDSCAR